MDFKRATELFADPDFDGYPVQVYEPAADEPPIPPEDLQEEDSGALPAPEPPPPGPGEKARKYVVHDVPVMVVKERVQYYGGNGKLITESLKDYTRESVSREFASLDDFLTAWSSADRKSAILHELEEQGVLLDALAEEVGRDFDAFDLVCHIAWGQPPLTRRERVDNVRKRDYFTKYGDKARAILDALLEKYADEGIEHIEDMNVLQVYPLNTLGTPVELISAFGGRDEFMDAVKELEEQLYAA